MTNALGSATSSNAVLTVIAPPPCATPSDGLVSWWPAEGDATDAAGQNHGTLQGGASFAAGKVGRAFSLNGTSQYASVPDSVSLRPASVTLECWVNFATTTGIRTLVNKPVGSGLYNSYALWYQDGQLNGCITTPTWATPVLRKTWAPALWTWHHVAYTFDSGAHTHALYLDGVAVGSGTAEGSIGYDTQPLLLGADISNGVYAEFFGGLLDEVAIYDRALSAAEVQAIYNAGSAGKCALPPSILVQPQSQTVTEGSNATMTVIASGTPALTYQWSLNGRAIPGATASSFTAAELDASSSGGVYAVLVANAWGSVTSAGATLTVVQCDPASHPLAVNAWKTTCEDKFYFDVSNLTGASLTGGRFDFYVYFDGANRTFYRNLQPWGPSDVLANGTSHLFTFCSPDHSITNFDCAIVYRGGGSCAASAKFRIATRDNLALVMTNTTQIVNPTNSPECPGYIAPLDYVSPQPRTADNPHTGAINCNPCPIGQWTNPLPTRSCAADATPQLDNCYKPSDPPQYADPACPKTGFKNVYAIKQWHGTWGPMSPMWGATAKMSGDGTCQTPPSPPSTQDTTKYLRKTAAGTYTQEFISHDGNMEGTDSALSDCWVGRYTGKIEGSASEDRDYPSEDWDYPGAGWGAIPDFTLADLPGMYCGKVGDYAYYLNTHPMPGRDGDVVVQPTYSAWGSTPTMTWDYEWNFSYPTNDGYTVTVSGHTRGQVTLDLTGGSYSYSSDYVWSHSSTDPQDGPFEWVSSESGRIDISATQVTSSSSGYAKLNPTIPVMEAVATESSGTVTYASAYTSADVNADCDTLLARWNLLDDVEYPWRSDGGITHGPLVTYNECSYAAPKILSPGEQDTNSPPWPSQPEGAVLGAPLPVHGPNGELYTYQPYFNFYHINYDFAESERGHPQGFIASLGAFSPFPNATQWLDEDQARVFPGGPFWAYGSEIENRDHAMFRLKDPYLTDTLGEWEDVGYGSGCLIKCKWAETLSSPAPPGNDLVFKQWNFNFRDFFDSYGWNAWVWYRNNLDTGCPGLSEVAPVRFTPVVIPPGQPGEGYYISPGSCWIADMSCQPLHYDYDCCRPALYVQPNSPGPDCTNGLVVAMPPAVCDGQYGSLWMGRADQSTSDAHACDNYVANRNNGLANPPSCDPQIELDLIWHDRAHLYETFVAPLGFGLTTPLVVDLDIDSDNNNGFAPPERSPAEDAIEDVLGLPGKIIAVNDGDANENGIPGFADGFTWGGWGDASNDRFVPLVLQIPSDLDIADCRLRIAYSASDPAGVARTGTPPAWQPAPGNLRIWTKDGDQPRDLNSANDPDWPGDYVAPGMYSDITKLGFSAGTRVVTFYVEGIAPSAVGALEIVATLYAGGSPPSLVGSDAVRVTVVKLNLDIARKNGTVVPHDQKQSNGSVVQLVPQANPGSLYPDGIFLNLPNLSVQPADAAGLVTLKLKKVGPWASQGKIRVHRQLFGQQAYSVFLDQDQTEATLTSAGLSASWRVDSTMGGVVDLALVAELPAGTELGRSTVRISSIPVEPADGAIIFVNPASTSPQWPYDNFVQNAAQDVYTAVTQMQPGDNVLIAQGTYVENSIPVYSSGVIAGLGGAWSVANPAQSTDPLADSFDYSSLPVLDGSGEINTWFDPASIFAGPGTYGGLVLRNGTYNPNSTDKSGGAIFVSNTDTPVRMGFCDFDSNTAFDFGGAVFLSSASDVQVNACKFENNKAKYVTQGDAVYDRGMGGAIASIESSLTVSNSAFAENSALVLASGDTPPPAGSAGGGGDIYLKNGSLTIVYSLSVGAVAGYSVDPTDPGGGSGASAYFTGDGGAILVHGQGDGAIIQLLNSEFSGSTAFGNGGAISLAHDSSPEARPYYVAPGLRWPPFDPTPDVLGGVCSGVISGVTFDHSQGGWQGGAISANGRGMNLTIQSCNFSACAAGVTHIRDGKGGAVSVAGGLQWLTAPTANIVVQDCTASSCTASGNGGGLYVTIRGQLHVVSSTITSCRARNAAGNLFRQLEGMGGGIHASAGGYVYLSGTTTLDGNVAMVSGGGLAAKSGRAYFDRAVTITGNWAFGSSADGYGNGGGVYVTTSVWDDPPPGPGWGAATCYQEHGWLSGNFLSSSIQGNTASRWGGGIYAGISPPWYNPPWYGPAYDTALVSPVLCTIQNNAALANANGRLLVPSEVAAERLSHPDGGTAALLDLTGAGISGTSLDIGVYGWDSIAPVSGGAVWGTMLGAQVISDYP